MNALESRKQLLIAESELNRAQLAQEWRTMADSVHSIASHAKTVSSLVLSGASLISGLLALRRIKSASAGKKRPWWQALLKGAQWVGSLWLESRPRPKS
jgi:hypothetical protein